MSSDNIFDSDCGAIVNTVNCVGVMGGGLAKQFRLRYPDMNHAYQQACARGEVKIGKMWNWWVHPLPGHSARGRWIVNFPTKNDWRNPSRLYYIEDGLKDLRLVIDDLHLTSIAIPALGCGLGGLKWLDVAQRITDSLEDVAAQGVRVEIYPPYGGKYTL